MRSVASCPADTPCISMVVMGVWPSLRMLPVMVDSKRLIDLLVERTDPGARERDQLV